MSVLLKNVLACDGVMEKARYMSVLVEGGRISSIGAPDWAPGADEVVDGKGKIGLLPGFVNTHTHAAMSLLRGIGEEAPLMEWLKEKIWPAEAKLKRDHVYWGTCLALLEMASNGITAFGDMYFFMDAVVEASLGMGMKCGVSRGIVGPEKWKLDEGLQLADAWKGREEFVTVQLAPHAPYTVPLPFLKEIVDAAKDRDLGLHFHFLEAEWETGYIRDEMKMSPAEYLNASGMPGAKQSVLAHCVWLDPKVIGEVDFSRMTIAHNPNSNQKLGSGMMDLVNMMGKTKKIALGTDGAASNNRLDIWGEMQSTALVHKGLSRDPTAIPARDVIRMATFEGAEALGFNKKGMIREGWAADFVLVDLDRPEYVGIDEENAAHFFVYAGGVSDIYGTMTAGKWLYRDRQFPGADREKILTEAREMRNNLLNG